ncbi:MAG: radical SAM protein [Spirochaetaceae bacterium]|nr:radical SAM protein [Spirochaetaceae bacterium]
MSKQTATQAKAVFYSSRNVFIAFTYVCNAFCKKCITRYHRFKNMRMTKAIIDFVISELIINQYTGVINLGSGEPLTNNDLSYFLEKLLKNNSKIKFRILTNGMLLNDKLPEFFFSNRVIWGITLDGFENYDLTNLQKGVDLNIVKQNIESICGKYGAERLYLNYTLNGQNFSSLKNFIDFSNLNKVKNIYVTNMKIFNGFRKYLDSYKFNQEKNGLQLNELEKYAKSLDFDKVSFGTNFFKNKYSECYNKNKVNQIIDIEGSVSFCYGQEDKIVGNIQDPDIYEKWYKLLLTLQNKKNNWCSNCCTNANSDGYFSVSKQIYQGIGDL